MASNADALAEAWQHFRPGDRQRAGEIALRIVQSDPEQVGRLALLGTIALAQNQLVEAAQLLPGSLGPAATRRG